MFSQWYSWNHCSLGLKQQSLTHTRINVYQVYITAINNTKAKSTSSGYFLAFALAALSKYFDPKKKLTIVVCLNMEYVMPTLVNLYRSHKTVLTPPLFIEVPVPNKGVLLFFISKSTICLWNCGTVPMVW